MRKIVITGGTGFVGRSVCEQLAAADAGCRLVVPTRRLANGRTVMTLPTVDLVEADVHDADQMTALLQGADALVHLVAILHGSAAQFDRVHVQLPRSLAAACARAGVRRVVHVSALGVAADAPSDYLRSKAAGEAVWQQALGATGGDLTILRPSVIFGADDRFTNLFARLQRLFPVLPLAGATARFQPVYIADVADAMVDCLTRSDTFGQVYELAGPRAYSLREMVDYVAKLSGRCSAVINLGGGLAALQARILSLLPNPPLSPDNLRSMQVDNLTDGARNYPGWNPKSLESIAPGYLAKVKVKSRLDGFRSHAGRAGN